MIRNTFSILHGIGEKLERRIWRQGVVTWEDFCSSGDIEGLGRESKAIYDDLLRSHSNHLALGDAPYFGRSIKRREHWRLFDSFRDGAVCLDIETNGLRPGLGGYVTVVGLYDGRDCRQLVRGVDLTAENLCQALRGHTCLITFYGAAFDVPFLLRCFPDVAFDVPHFDLCFAGRRIGLNGGLKRLEEQFGIVRDASVRGLNGYDAVMLWEQVEQGSLEARQVLLTYNREDVVNLLGLAEILYQRLRSSTGIEEHIPCGVA